MKKPIKITFTESGRWQAVLLLVLVALMTACAPLPQRDTGESVLTPSEQAQEHERAGRFDAAAVIWERLAKSAVNGQQHVFRLNAVDALLKAQQFEIAANLLAQVDRFDLGRTDQARFDLARAELALIALDVELARALLGADTDSWPPALQRRAQRLLAQISIAEATPEAMHYGAFRQFAEQSPLRPGSEDYLAEAVRFMRGLDTVSNRRLQEFSAAAESNLGGWLDLLLLARNTLPNNTDSKILDDWFQQNPLHALDRQQAEVILQAFQQSFVAPERIAVMLPVDGRFSGPARAIRDGIMTSFLSEPVNRGNRLRFYPLTDEPLSAARSYIQALEDGVDMVIGPLTREAVMTLLGMPSLQTPVLTLNQIESMDAVELSIADQIFSFALLPESEASQAAARGIAEGHTRAAILAPENAWGERLSLAFRESFESAGGTIVYSGRYAPSEADYSTLLKNMLDLDSSESRKRALQAQLGIQLDFESQRRTDLDMIFMAARPREGRLLRPQLRFHDAGDIPVFATSALYSGQPDSRADRDLNGIYLPLPAIQATREGFGTPLSSRGDGALDAFYALGADAWTLLPYLELLANSEDLSITGVSGRLRVSGSGEVERQLQWTRFRRGTPQAIEPLLNSPRSTEPPSP